MKKFLSILLALVSVITLSFTLTACGDDPGTESLTYETQSDGTLYVTGINDGTEKVIVPGKKDGKVVSGIGEDAFRSNKNVKEVTLPSSVQYIDASAFYGASKLTKINLGKVVTIGKNAFRGTKLLACDLSSAMTIDDYAFYGTSISSVEIPTGIIEVSKSCFSSCSLLLTVTLPTTVKTINESAFNGCNSLSTINLNNVKVIKEGAFESCSSLYSLSLNSVVDIGLEAFASCALQTVTIGANCQRIYTSAFFQCSSLGSVSLGSATSDEWYILLNYGNNTTGLIKHSPSYPEGWNANLADTAKCAQFLTKSHLAGSYICTRAWSIEHSLGEPSIVG